MLSLYETNDTPDDFAELLKLDIYYQLCLHNKDSHIYPNVATEFNDIIFMPEAERKNKIMAVISKQDDATKRQLEQEDEIQYI